jgi:hypothetical protein
MIAYFNFLRKFKNYIILSLKRLGAFPPLLLRVLFVLVILFSQTNSSVTEAHKPIRDSVKVPSDTNPIDRAEDISRHLTRSWSLANPDGENGTKTVYLGLINNPPVAHISFKVPDDCPPFCGNPPYTPSNPSPADGAIGININPTLSWSGGAPDGGMVHYDIWLDTKNPITNQVCGCKDTSFIPPTLEPGKTYYWRIFAWQSLYTPAFGPMWNFTTSFLTYLPLVILEE